MNDTLTINGDVEGKTLEEFGKLIEQRKKWLGETTIQSLSAIAITILKSIRAVTKVANPRKFNVDLKEASNLFHGLQSLGGKKVPCLRVKGSKVRYQLQQDEVFIVVDRITAPKVENKVFKWKRRSGKIYYLSARSLTTCMKWIKDAEKRRINKYKGLARLAIGQCMHKVAQNSIGSTGVQSTNDAKIVAQKNTNVKSSSQGFNSGIASITIEDNLNYALNALQGGKGDVDMAMKKAMNSMIGMLNKKCENMLGFQKLDKPFSGDLK